jgi:sec-independent protein translocase protein TatA
MFNNIGSGEIIVVLLVLLFLFGGKKLPELARGLGESGKEIKNAKKEIEDALSDIKIEDDRQDKPYKEGKTEGGESDNV